MDFRAANNGDFEFFFHLHKNTLGPYVDRVWGGMTPNNGRIWSAHLT